MLTNRRKKQNSNQSPMGRSWYPLGGGFDSPQGKTSSRNNYKQNSFQNTSKKDRNPFDYLDFF